MIWRVGSSWTSVSTLESVDFLPSTQYSKLKGNMKNITDIPELHDTGNPESVENYISTLFIIFVNHSKFDRIQIFGNIELSVLIFISVYQI